MTAFFWDTALLALTQTALLGDPYGSIAIGNVNTDPEWVSCLRKGAFCTNPTCAPELFVFL